MEVCTLSNWESARVESWTPGVGGIVIFAFGEQVKLDLRHHVFLNSMDDVSLKSIIGDSEPQPGDELLVSRTSNPNIGPHFEWTFKSDIIRRLPQFISTIRLVAKQPRAKQKITLWSGNTPDPLLKAIISDNKPHKGVYQISGITMWFERLTSDYRWCKIYHPF